MKRTKFAYQISSGQSLIEMLLVIGLMAIILPAIFVGIIAARSGRPQQEQSAQATALLQSAEEIVRSVREAGWNTFAIDGTFHPVVSGSGWMLASGNEIINGFTRSILIADVYRDANGAIANSSVGNTLDPSTKKVTVTVSWGSSSLSSSSYTSYYTRYLDNALWTQSTVAEFNTGVKSSTVVTNTTDGEVALGAGGGGGDWCVPSYAITTVDLSRQGVPTSIGATSGTIVTGTGGNASGPTFVKTAVTGNSPPQTTVTGQYNISKANAVFTESTYGYIATTNHSQEIQVLDLNATSGSPPIFSLVGWFDATGNGEGDSVFVVNNVGYMTDGNKFYTFDMSSHTGSRPQLNPLHVVTLAGTGNKVTVVGTYAYIATSSTTSQLQIINVSDPTNPSIVSTVSMGNSQPGMDLSVNATGTRVYLVTSYASSSTPDFFVLDTSTKSSISKIGSGYNTSGMSPKGVSIATGNRALIVGTGGTLQYQVVNISNETTPVSCAGLAVTNGAYAVANVLQADGFAYAYIATGDSSKELKIILGGAGGVFTTSGTYTSAPFDAGFSTAFNRFTADVSQPSQTTLQMQVAVASPVNSACTNSTYSFIGPDKTSGTFYTPTGSTITGTIPITTIGSYTNPGQCFKYKLFFTSTDNSQTPVVNDVNINYSP